MSNGLVDVAAIPSDIDRNLFPDNTIPDMIRRGHSLFATQFLMDHIGVQVVATATVRIPRPDIASIESSAANAQRTIEDEQDANTIGQRAIADDRGEAPPADVSDFMASLHDM